MPSSFARSAAHDLVKTLARATASAFLRLPRLKRNIWEESAPDLHFQRIDPRRAKPLNCM